MDIVLSYIADFFKIAFGFGVGFIFTSLFSANRRGRRIRSEWRERKAAQQRSPEPLPLPPHIVRGHSIIVLGRTDNPYQKKYDA